MAIILSVSEIDDSVTAKSLEEIAYTYGLMDMRQILMVAQPYMPFYA